MAPPRFGAGRRWRAAAPLAWWARRAASIHRSSAAVGMPAPLIPAGLSVVQVLPAPDRVTIVTVPTPSRSACPLRGGLSGRAHSRYTGVVQNVPFPGNTGNR